MNRIIILLVIISLAGCVSNNSYQIEQNNSFSPRVKLEKAFTDRISVIGAVSHYKVKEQRALSESVNPESFNEESDVLKVDETFFEEPDEVGLNLGVTQASLELKLYPVKVDWANIYLGLGFNYIDLDFKASSGEKVGKSANDDIQFKTTLGIYFPIGQSFGASISSEALYEALFLDTNGEQFSVTAHWLVSKAIQLDLGYFYSRLLLESRLDVLAGTSSSRCTSNAGYNRCNRYVEPVDVGSIASGVQAGVTLRF